MMKQLELFNDPREISVSQMVEEFAETAGQKKDPQMARKLILEEFIEWVEAAGASPYDVATLKMVLYQMTFSGEVDPKHELKEMADLEYVLYGYARTKDYDLGGAVKAVHNNNMGRMFQADGTIQRREDGKILKNPDYPKVDLSEFTGES